MIIILEVEVDSHALMRFIRWIEVDRKAKPHYIRRTCEKKHYIG